MKLHLGCGQVYLQGYVNIDYPMTEHTVQQIPVADKFADLTDMRYRSGTIEEVRLHHVFEHFPRAQAVALLVSWHSWLKKGGRVHIEVPEFDATAKLVLNPKTKERARKIAIRHITGSNEAPWAVHYDIWNERRFKELFNIFGLELQKVDRNKYMATRNIVVIGEKKKKTSGMSEIRQQAREYLRQFTLNDSEFETRLLNIWMKAFSEQLSRTFTE